MGVVASGIILVVVPFIIENYIVAIGFVVAAVALFIAERIFTKNKEDFKTRMARWDREFKEYGSRKANEARVAQREKINSDLVTLDCKLVPDKIELSNLPKTKQTVYLRFRRLKNTMCRPFAGS